MKPYVVGENSPAMCASLLKHALRGSCYHTKCWAFLNFRAAHEELGFHDELTWRGADLAFLGCDLYQNGFEVHVDLYLKHLFLHMSPRGMVGLDYPLSWGADRWTSSTGIGPVVCMFAHDILKVYIWASLMSSPSVMPEQQLWPLGDCALKLL